MRPVVPGRPADELLRMSTPGRLPDSTDQQAPSQPERSGWWLALLVIPVLCCAGPALLAAVGVVSLGALFAAGTGQVVLAVTLAVAVVTTVAILAVRSRRRSVRWQ